MYPEGFSQLMPYRMNGVQRRQSILEDDGQLRPRHSASLGG